MIGPAECREREAELRQQLDPGIRIVGLGQNKPVDITGPDDLPIWLELGLA